MDEAKQVLAGRDILNSTKAQLACGAAPFPLLSAPAGPPNALPPCPAAAVRSIQPAAMAAPVKQYADEATRYLKGRLGGAAPTELQVAKESQSQSHESTAGAVGAVGDIHLSTSFILQKLRSWSAVLLVHKHIR